MAGRVRCSGMALAAIVLGAYGATTADAQGGEGVTGQVTVKPSNYAGPCPVSVEFVGTLRTFTGNAYSYRWERSDNTFSPVQVVPMSSDFSPVSVRSSWRVSRPRGEVFRGWERLHVLSPSTFVSAPASFQVVCR